MQTTFRSTAPTRPLPADTLRRVLTVNAATSTLGGAAALVAGEPVAELLGTDHTDRVRAAGAGLLVFGLAVLALARRPAATRIRFAPAVSAADVSWVAASLAAIASGWFSTRGAWVMGAVGVAVLGFAVAQVWFARRRTR